MTALGARVWPWVPAGLLSCMLAGLGTMAIIATHDPGFALERDYYQKAVHYDREIAQRGENARLGWSVSTEFEFGIASGDPSLTVEVRDAAGPVTGAQVSVEALRNADAHNPIDATLVERAPGKYQGRLPMRRAGLWELRLTFERGRERFTAVERRDVPGRTR